MFDSAWLPRTTPAAWTPGVTGQAFEPAGGVDPTAGLVVALVNLAQVVVLIQGLVESDVELVADQLGDA